MSSRYPGGVAVYTTLYGGYDRLAPPVQQDIDVDWICFTDDARTAVPGWTTVVDPPRYPHPRMAAKWAKLLPHRALPDHRWTVFIDANVRVTSARFARESLAAIGQGGLAAWVHPDRDCIYAEARECLRQPKCAGQPILDQVATYAARGHPQRWGLYACCSLARDRTAARSAELGERWLAECERWSYRDQLSLPFVLRQMGIRPGVFAYHLHAHSLAARIACGVRASPSLRDLAYRLGAAGAAARRAARDSRAVRAMAPPAEAARPPPDPFSPNPWYRVSEHLRSG